jgi:hypothetical protein
MLLIAAAFAGRGAGTCAVSPDRRIGLNIGVIESGTLAARLQTSGIRIADDGASCDRDGYLDPGESGTLRVTVANSGVVAAEGVAVRATTTSPGTPSFHGFGPPFPIAVDGGVIEVSTDGTSWRDVTELGATPGYNATVVPNVGNPLQGRRAFTVTNPSFPNRDPVTLDFGTRLAGQAVQLRFRIGTSTAVAAGGWESDELEVTGITNTPFPGLVVEPTRCVAPLPP